MFRLLDHSVGSHVICITTLTILCRSMNNISFIYLANSKPRHLKIPSSSCVWNPIRSRKEFQRYFVILQTNIRLAVSDSIKVKKCQAYKNEKWKMHTAHLAKKHSQLKIALAEKNTYMADTPGPERHLTQKSNKFKKSEI